MRFTSVLCLAALAVGSLHAEVLMPDAALQRALSSGNVMKAPAAVSPRLVYTQSEADSQTPAVYVFNTGAEGYMVVSADDVAVPVLGYSDSGVIDAADMPENLRSWLAFYADEMAWARRNGVATYKATSRADSRASIAPMIQTHWDQDAPYYNMTPTIGSQHCVTGCVATAMAQIMKYHQWPQGPGSGTSTLIVGGKTYTVDFSQITFDWANMLNDYTSSATAAQKDAVALLMKACGFATQMSYGTNASGTATVYAQVGYASNFGYDVGIESLARDSYTLSDWNALIYNQMAASLPVQYGGQSSGGGHSFVIDGYSQDNYFHVNWGWSGMSDGYFLLTSLDPDSQGIGGSSTNAGFNTDQMAICNIRRPVAGSTPNPRAFADSMTMPTGSISAGTSMTYTLTDFQASSINATTSGKLALRLVGSAGTRYCTGTTEFSLKPGSYYPSYSVSVNLPSSIPAGSYTIEPIWRESNNDSWKVVMIGASSTHYTAVGNGSSITVTAESPAIKATGFTYDPIYPNTACKITVTLQNNTSIEYNGKIAARLKQGASVKSTGTYNNVVVPANSTIQFDYNTKFSGISAGTYVLTFIDGSGTAISTKATNITVSAVPTLSVEYGNIKTPDGNTTGLDPHNLVFQLPVNVTSGVLDTQLILCIFPYQQGNVSAIAQFPQNVYMVGPANETVTFNCDFTEGEYNAKYFISVYNSGNWVGGQLVFTTAEAGINDVEADADEVNVEIYNLQGVKVAGDIPGHYIRVATSRNGARSAKHVIVK